MALHPQLNKYSLYIDSHSVHTAEMNSFINTFYYQIEDADFLVNNVQEFTDKDKITLRKLVVQKYDEKL